VRKILHPPGYCPANSKLLHQLHYSGPQKVKERSTARSKLFYIFMLLSWKSCMCAAPKYENALYMVYPIMLQCLQKCLKYFTHKNKYWNSWGHILESNNTFYDRHTDVGLFFKKK